MSDVNSAVPPQPQDPAAQGPALQTLAQYLKDLSFENPSPLESLTQNNQNPTVNVNVSVNTRLARDSIHELAVSVQVHTLSGDKTLFMIELIYCGLFALVNIPKDQVEPILRVHCASLLFPYIRQIVGDATRDGGFAPLYLNMIDFAQLYQQYQATGASAGTSSNNPATA
ncbi:MAG TPA: protein-export chaperone SecB [Alphaproteobacteria bacterium]|jgi:preprotein translocase subunit SecB